MVVARSAFWFCAACSRPFGMVMIEAMACGTPVVALRGGAVPEVVVDGVTGIICQHPHQSADALRRVRDIPGPAMRHTSLIKRGVTGITETQPS